MVKNTIINFSDTIEQFESNLTPRGGDFGLNGMRSSRAESGYSAKDKVI